jgi:hypothetical protein
VEAWRAVEFAAVRAAQRRIVGSPQMDVSTAHKAVRALHEEGFIADADRKLFDGLRGLRNQAAHSPEFEPGAQAGLEYIDAATVLRARLDIVADT